MWQWCAARLFSERIGGATPGSVRELPKRGLIVDRELGLTRKKVALQRGCRQSSEPRRSLRGLVPLCSLGLAIGGRLPFEAVTVSAEVGSPADPVDDFRSMTLHPSAGNLICPFPRSVLILSIDCVPRTGDPIGARRPTGRNRVCCLTTLARASSCNQLIGARSAIKCKE